MFLEEHEYRYIMDLYDGKLEKNLLLSELTEWFEGEFQFRLYGFLCDTINNGVPRLRMVLWDEECKKKMNGWNRDYQKEERIRNKFAELCIKYNQHTEYQEAGKVFVCYETLSDEIKKRTISKVSEKIHTISGYDIWDIVLMGARVDIFFETDAQVELHKTDGVCDLLKQKINSIVQEADEYHLFEKGVWCCFVSHQMLNERYGGNWGHYFNDN